MTSVIAGPSNRRSNCFKSYEAVQASPRKRACCWGVERRACARNRHNSKLISPKLRRRCYTAGARPVGAPGGARDLDLLPVVCAVRHRECGT